MCIENSTDDDSDKEVASGNYIDNVDLGREKKEEEESLERRGEKHKR